MSNVRPSFFLLFLQKCLECIFACGPLALLSQKTSPWIFPTGLHKKKKEAREDLLCHLVKEREKDDEYQSRTTDDALEFVHLVS